MIRHCIKRSLPSNRVSFPRAGSHFPLAIVTSNPLLRRGKHGYGWRLSLNIDSRIRIARAAGATMLHNTSCAALLAPSAPIGPT